MQMRKIFLVLVLTVVALVGSGVRAEDAEKPWSVDLNVAFMSDYMFRGQNLYDGASIQPYIGAGYDTGYGTIGAYNWSHISADGSANVEEFFEMDWGLTYELALDPVTVTVGNLWYTYPNDNDDIEDTTESFISLALDDSSYNDFYTINPKFTASKDWDVFDYYYYELNFSHTYEGGVLGDGVSMTPYVTFGFTSDGEKVYEDDGLVQVSEGISVTMPLGNMTVSPSINYTHKVDDLTVDQFWFGVTLGYSL
ncbi:MAG: hypothetical protein K1X83_14140 [Oligoflexia bacterium]|nr:hypothetical protein [Oligoflexia bacterium]